MESPYGLSWLADSCGTKLRVLVSDYLYCCVASVTGHMREAGIHWLELLDSVERNNARFSDSLSVIDGEVVPATRPSASPIEHLTVDLVSLHRAGMIRAVASALDCVAGAVAGIAALPEPIMRVGWPGIRRYLAKLPANQGDEVVAFQQHVASELERAISSCGPPGWLEWVLDYRNMLVHRGRRIETGQLEVSSQPRLDVDGSMQPTVSVLTHLPRDPARSDVEVFLESGGVGRGLLSEPSELTLLATLVSTRDLIECMASLLSVACDKRRANPLAIRQPLEQWPKGPSSERGRFEGYQPGALTFEANMLVSGGAIVRRLRSAALDDANRGRWETFD